MSAKNPAPLNLLLIVLSLVLLGGLTWLLDRGDAPPPQTKPQTEITAQSDGKMDQDIALSAPAPDVAFTAPNGKSVRLHDYKGKIVLLNFWASWCAPCIVELPQLVALSRMMPDDLVILAVSADADPASMTAALSRHAPGYDSRPNFVVLRDINQTVSLNIFQTMMLPETIIIAPDLNMRRKIVGTPLKWDSPDAAAMLSAYKTK